MKDPSLLCILPLRLQHGLLTAIRLGCHGPRGVSLLLAWMLSPCLVLALVDLDNDGLEDTWELGCSNSGGTRTNAGNPDSDGDLIRDDTEVGQSGIPSSPRDTNGDATIDACSPDSDEDGISDLVESGCTALCTNPRDTDGDGLADYRDTDSDQDGLPDSFEGSLDTDNDLLPDYRDTDSDNDLIADSSEGSADTDKDNILNFRDSDSDDDGIPDRIESGCSSLCTDPRDTDQDGTKDYLDSDSDGDLISDTLEGQGDPDQDGIPNYVDDDSDNDGISDALEGQPFSSGDRPVDTDQDGIADFLDSDSDNDDIPDNIETLIDTDDDEIPNFRDTDSDNDGRSDREEGTGDQDEDGIKNYVDAQDQDGPAGDLDNDGIRNDVDLCPYSYDPTQPDQDEDGAGDACDDDLDGDGFSNGNDTCASFYDPTQPDLDGDGLGDACDPDLDGDGAANDDEVRLGTDPADGSDHPIAAGGGWSCSSAAPTPRPSPFPLLLTLAAWFRLARPGARALTSLRPRRRERAHAPEPSPPRRFSGFPLPLRMVSLCCLGLLGAASPSRRARAEGYDAKVLHPAPLGMGGMAVESTQVLAPLSFQAETFVGYAARPVVIKSSSGQELAPVIDHLTSSDLRLSLGLPLRLVASLELPLTLHQLGAGSEAVNGAGIGDLSFGLKWQALDSLRSPVGVAVWVDGFVPTGNPVQLQGDGTTGLSARAGVDRRLGPLLLACNGGLRWRGEVLAYRGTLRGPQLEYGAMAALAPHPRAIALVAELSGALGLGESLGSSPVELLLSTHLHRGPLLIQLGTGVGLSDAVGVPRWRLVLGLGYRSARGDADGDGISTPEDQCPERAEDFDRTLDQDGCPDEDNDGDGIPDEADRCPNLAEDRDGVEDNDGCPDDDNDGDGIPDSSDKCPNQPEDLDTFEDDDGCPEDDNDGDGIVDSRDRCPMVTENRNGFEDEDGCPDTPPTYVFKAGVPVVFNQLQFQSGRFELLPASYSVLDEVVESLRAQAQVRVRIEGHTDDQGDEQKNLALSQQRALSIMNYLVGAGIDPRRLSHAGYGETRPVAPNDSEANRALNRRVEIVAIDEAVGIPAH